MIIDELDHSSMATRWIDAKGIQLRYDHTGVGRRTIVLIHEMGGTLESWDDIIGPLCAFASVMRYDQRGVGLSEKVPGPVTIEQLAGDLANLLDALAIEGPVAVVGTAVGAAVAAAFAATYPDRIGALLMLAPALNLSGDRRAAAISRIEAIERDGVRAAFAAVPSNVPPKFAALRLASDRMGLCAIWRMLVDLDMNHVLQRIACPTLVAAATRDTARPPEYVAEVAARIRGSRTVSLDTTHYMAIETPKLVHETIVLFLKECGFG